jgi:hypothetical protein
MAWSRTDTWSVLVMSPHARRYWTLSATEALAIHFPYAPPPAANHTPAPHPHQNPQKHAPCSNAIIFSPNNLLQNTACLY